MYAAYREVWDDLGGAASTTEASASSLQHQLLSSTASATTISHHLYHSFQSQQNAAVLQLASMQQSSPTVFDTLLSSLPSSVSRPADENTRQLAQLQQLIETYRLPDQASSDLTNWYAQELLGFPHEVTIPPQQLWRPTHNVCIDGSISGTSEARMPDMYSTQNNSDALPVASEVVTQMPSAVCAQETFRPSADRTLTQFPAVSQYTVSDMQPPYDTDCVYQLSSLTRLQQLQQMYTEAAANALHCLYVLQQQVVPATTSTVATTSRLSTISPAAGTSEDAVCSQSSAYIPHSD